MDIVELLQWVLDVIGLLVDLHAWWRAYGPLLQAWLHSLWRRR